MTAPSSSEIPQAARERERSLLVAILSDLAIFVVFIIVGLWANSLTILAECLRGGLLWALEVVLLVLMRRIHRGRTYGFDYGPGKLEQFANLGIGCAMGLGGLWVGAGAAYRWWNPPDQVAVGLFVAAAVGLLNVAQNALAFRALWLAGRDGRSVIMTGQIRTRLAKLLSSVVVLAALALNALFRDHPVGIAAEALGSGFVALVMLDLAVGMCRSALPSLLDRTLAEVQQEMINRCLARHFEDYDALVAVRSRLSGNVPIVEIVLGFAGDRRMAEVQQVVDRVAGDVEELIPAALVLVVPVSCGTTG